MASKWLNLWAVLSSFALSVAAVPYDIAQEALASPLQTGGVLRRFEGSNYLEDVLRIAESHDLDIWQIAPSHVDVYSPFSQEPPDSLLRIPHKVSQVTLDNKAQDSPLHIAQPWNLDSLHNSSFHSAYHPLHEVEQFIHDLATTYPETASVINLGHSGQGREMLGLKVSKAIALEGDDGDKKRKKKEKPGKERTLDPSKKLGFVVVGAQHAREWVATATPLYLAHALVSNSSEPKSLSSLLDAFDFYIIPVPNPDGYAYTWESDRFWYKNRQIMGPDAKCVGLDMNRNWGYKWRSDVREGGPTFDEVSGETLKNDRTEFDAKSRKKHHTPADPCSHWYPGHRPFEAPEVNNIANYITTLPNLVGFIDLRSYGQMLSTPYSYSCKKYPKDAEDQMEAAMGAAHALAQVHGTQFTTGTLCELLYKAPGNMIDWMYKSAGIKYTYAAHLRDTGTYGFSLPEEWIRPVGEETGNMIEYLVKFIARQMKSG